MGEVKTPNADPNSAEFKRGVEAGLNSAEDTRNWKAGNELGLELKEEGETKRLDHENPFQAGLAPLFLEDSSDGQKGNAQDEKDSTEE